jgi:2-haloalkanoic acid dehalogenase type II
MAPKIKYIFFDFMGTCLDWHSSASAALPSSLSPDQRSDLALRWRVAYFRANAARSAAGLPPENIDVTLLRTLDEVLPADQREAFTLEAKNAAVQAWHHQKAWPDVGPALASLRAAGYETFVLANGTTRLQLDLVKSSGLRFDLLMSSQMLGVYKPHAVAYEKGMELVGARGPEECVQVAAHAYDTAGARKVGMRTVYVRRWTDDVHEDGEVVRRENEVYLEGMEGLVNVIRGME